MRSVSLGLVVLVGAIGITGAVVGCSSTATTEPWQNGDELVAERRAHNAKSPPAGAARPDLTA